MHHADTKVLIGYGKIDRRHVHEYLFPVESLFQEDPVYMRIEPSELTGRRILEALDHLVDDLADFPLLPPAMTEESMEHFGKGEHHLPLRKHEQ
jgi:hypothetical protein